VAKPVQIATVKIFLLKERVEIKQAILTLITVLLWEDGCGNIIAAEIAAKIQLLNVPTEDVVLEGPVVALELVQIAMVTTFTL
jgi:uncharacterized phage protein gp47/JayE